MPSHYEITGHTADLGLVIAADNLDELYVAAVGALAEVMVKGPRDGQVEWLPVKLEGTDHTDLMVQLLNEVVYLLDASGLLVVAFELTELGPLKLAGRLGAVAFEPARHEITQAIKAVTYHQAKVEQTKGRWQAHLVADV